MNSSFRGTSAGYKQAQAANLSHNQVCGGGEGGGRGVSRGREVLVLAKETVDVTLTSIGNAVYPGPNPKP